MLSHRKCYASPMNPLQVVRCPNFCLDGMVKTFYNSEKALFDLVKCPHCKGKGKVSYQESKIIEKKLAL